MPLLSQRAYAASRKARGLPGGTHRAVQKAVQKGRITKNADGLIDSDAADAAWAANSDESFRRNPGQEDRRAAALAHSDALAGARPARPSGAPAPPPTVPAAVPVFPAPPAEPGSLAEAATLEKTYKAKLAELEYRRKSGELLPANQVRDRWMGIVSLTRNRLLNLPAKAAQRMPHLAPADVAELEELVREALEELADSAAAA